MLEMIGIFTIREKVGCFHIGVDLARAASKKNMSHVSLFRGDVLSAYLSRCEAVIALRSKEGRDAPAVRGRLVKLKADLERTLDRPIRPRDRELSPKMPA